MGVWSDGAPVRPSRADVSRAPSVPSAPPAAAPAPVPAQVVRARQSAPERAERAVARIRQFEGPRGYSSRLAVHMRYVAYFAVICVASALTQALTEGISNASNGGMWMFLSSTVIVFGGALGTVFYANLRNEVIERVRHYVFGIAVLPGLLVAVFLRATREFLGNDAFGGTLQIALPIVFLCTVILPALVFIKELSGIRTLHRSRMDDQEAMALWTRQDGIQR